MIEQKNATSTVVAKQFVNARELHKILNPSVKFGTWIQRKIEEYGFIENEDYFTDDYTKIREQKISLILSLSSFSKDDNNPELEITNYEIEPRLEHKDYLITLDMAKELSMVEKNEVGRKVRKYFIEVEKRFRLLESKYKQFVEEKQEKIDILLTKQEIAKANFKDARNILAGIDRDIKEIRTVTFQNWQDNQMVQPLPLVFEE